MQVEPLEIVIDREGVEEGFKHNRRRFHIHKLSLDPRRLLVSDSPCSNVEGDIPSSTRPTDGQNFDRLRVETGKTAF